MHPKNLPKFYLLIGVVAVAFFGMLFTNRLTKKKIYEENASSVELIKKSLGGTKEFDALLEKQKNYMDSYYDALYPDEEEEVLEEESTLEAPKSEESIKPEQDTIVEAEIEEVKEDTKNE